MRACYTFPAFCMLWLLLALLLEKQRKFSLVWITKASSLAWLLNL
jgi:hypothetical protein